MPLAADSAHCVPAPAPAGADKDCTGCPASPDVCESCYSDSTAVGRDPATKGCGPCPAGCSSCETVGTCRYCEGTGKYWDADAKTCKPCRQGEGVRDMPWAGVDKQGAEERRKWCSARACCVLTASVPPVPNRCSDPNCYGCNGCKACTEEGSTCTGCSPGVIDSCYMCNSGYDFGAGGACLPTTA